MFIGHFAVGFGAKSVAPRVSLGTLFLAAQFIDLLWPTLLLLGVEHVRIVPGATVVTPLVFDHYPVSHSLIAVLGWTVLVPLVPAAESRCRLCPRRSCRQPLGARRDCAPAGFAPVSRRRHDGRPQCVVVAACHADHRRMPVRTGRLAVCARHLAERRGRPLGIRGAGGVPARHPCRQPVRPAAAEHRGHRLAGACAMAAGAMGLLDR